MRRGSTPSVELTIPGIDLTSAVIHVAIAQGESLLVKSEDDVSAVYDSDEDETTLTVSYGQADTLSFCPERHRFRCDGFLPMAERTVQMLKP